MNGTNHPIETSKAIPVVSLLTLESGHRDNLVHCGGTLDGEAAAAGQAVYSGTVPRRRWHRSCLIFRTDNVRFRVQHGLHGGPRTAASQPSQRKEETMGKIVKKLAHDEAAQGMAEYALLAGLIAVVAIAAVTLLGTNIKTTLNNIATAISGS